MEMTVESFEMFAYFLLGCLWVWAFIKGMSL